MAPRKYHTAEEAREAKRQQDRTHGFRRRRRAARELRLGRIHDDDGNRVRPPYHVRAAREAERDRRAAFAETANHIVLGDPPPWRSALNQRGT